MTLLFAFYSVCITIVCMILAKQKQLEKQLDNKSIKNLQELSKHYSDELDKRDNRIKLLESKNRELEEECDQLDSILEQKLFDDFGTFQVQIEPNDEQNNILKGLVETLREIQKSNTDIRSKEIGDRVRLWDFSFHMIKGSNEHNLSSKYAEMDAVVIATSCGIKTKDIMNNKRVLDICIRYEDGTEVFTHSDFVKRIDNYNK